MSTTHLTEPERQWLLNQAREFGPDWWRRRLELEDPAARGLNAQASDVHITRAPIGSHA